MEKRNCSLIDAWNLYLDTRPLTKEANIKKEMNRFYKHIYLFWGDVELSNIHSKDIMMFQKSLFQKGLSAQTVKNCLSLLRALYNRAKKYEIYKGDIPYFEMPSTNNARIRFLTEIEAKTLLDSLHKHSELWHDITLFALHTGMRAGEIFSLNPSSVNLSHKIVTIYETKNRTTRTIPLNNITSTISKKYLLKQQRFLFSNSQILSVSKIFRQTVEDIGLNKNISNNREKFVFHSLRHTFASWLVQKGIPLQIVSQLLGHKTLKVTMRYAHLAPEQGFYAVTRLPYNISKHI